MTERRIGIDFGTSTSVVRVRRYEDGKSDDPKTVTFNGAPKVPTLIQTIEDGQSCYYGYDADVQKRRAAVYRNFKLDLESGDAAKREKARELTAKYLRYLGQVYRHQSEGGFLGDSGDTVKTFVSYPVRWSESTRAFMLQAARDAGFPAVEGLDEAEASIRAVTEQYADHLTGKGYFRADRPCTILLIDMGAGTTDLVLCRHMPGDAAKTEILCTWPQGGEALFGGSRVDALLYKYITDSFPDMQAVARLPLSKFKAWKEELVSPALQRGESVDYFEALKPIEDALDIDLCFEPIDRARFETLAADYLPELPKLVAGALAAAKLDGDAVDLVLLTGGHSQWYFVREMLLGHMPQFGELRLGKIAADPGRIVSIARPEETVALGLVYSPTAVKRPEPVTAPQPQPEPAPMPIPSPVEEESPTPVEEFQLSSKGDGLLITNYLGSRSHVVIPETIRGRKVVGIERIASHNDLFRPNKILTRVEVPDSVRYIGQYAFAYCAHLEFIRLPENLELIDMGAFEGCKNLKYVAFGDEQPEPGVVRFPRNLKRIGIGAFRMGTGFNIASIFTEVSLSRNTKLPLFSSQRNAQSVFGNCAIFFY